MDTELDIGIFKPVKDDYSVTMLERIFGPIIRGITEGTGIGGGAETASMLTQLVTIFNLAILFVAVVILTYSIYVAIMDTASDGKLMGHQVSAGKTVLRTSIGVVLLLPVSGGFTIVQLIVFYLLVWGSGLADTAWSRVADNNFAGIGYSSPSSHIGGGIGSVSPAVRQQFGDALKVRTAGYICATSSNKLASTLGRDADIAPVNAERRDRPAISLDPPNSRTYNWYFVSGSQSYNNAYNFCGSVRAKFQSSRLLEEGSWRRSLNDTLAIEVTNFTKQYNDILIHAAIAGQIAGLNEIDAKARELSADIISDGKPRNEKAIKDKIASALVSGVRKYETEFTAEVKRLSNQNDFSRKLLESSKKSGWVFAATWQRVMANIYQKMAAHFDGVNFETSIPRARDGIFGTVYRTSSAESQVFFREYSDVMVYFDSISTAFDAAAINGNVQDVGQSEFDNGNSILNWLADFVVTKFTKQPESNTWTDPLIEVQEAGSSLLTASAALKAIPVGTSIFGGVAAAASGLLDTLLSPIAFALLVLGGILAVGIPFLPVVYFIGAVIGWLILSLEAVVSIPLSVLLMFSPNREGSLIGQNHNVLITLVGVLFRPLLIIIGLVCAYIVMRIGIDLINAYYVNIIHMMVPENSMTQFYIFVGALAVYAMLIVTTCLHSCTLITSLPDYVLGWIGTGLNTLAKANPNEGIGGHIAPVNSGMRLSTLSAGGPGASSKFGNYLAKKGGATKSAPRSIK